MWRYPIVVATGCLLAAAAACSSSTHASNAPSQASPAGSAPVTHTGSVDVLSAGSLQDLMAKSVEGGFHTATGYTEQDFSAGSSDLAADIKDKIKVGDVFVSASPSVNTGLQGAANGNWVSWYATFATSQLVLGYNPKSRFAKDLTSMPWYDVVTLPGFRLGLTPPASDPKGVLAVRALDEIATARKLPALRTLGATSTNQFPETNLEAEVESGAVDAGFFYLAEAKSAAIPTVALTGVDLAADYTITILNGAPHLAAADAFVTYLLGPLGQHDLSQYGFVLATPIVATGAVPTALENVIP